MKLCNLCSLEQALCPAPLALEYNCTSKLDWSSLHSCHSALLLWSLKLTAILLKTCRGDTTVAAQHHASLVYQTRRTVSLPIKGAFGHSVQPLLAKTDLAAAEVYVWGRGEYGRLGLGDKGGSSRLRPCKVKAMEGHKVIQASCGGTHTMVLTAEGRIFGWGRGSFGRLGTGHEKDHHSPVEVFLPGQRLVSCHKWLDGQSPCQPHRYPLIVMGL